MSKSSNQIIPGTSQAESNVILGYVLPILEQFSADGVQPDQVLSLLGHLQTPQSALVYNAFLMVWAHLRAQLNVEVRDVVHRILAAEAQHPGGLIHGATGSYPIADFVPYAPTLLAYMYGWN